MTSSFWKAFAVVFVVAFAANMLVSWLLARAGLGGAWHWDTTTASAVTVAVILGWFARKGGSTGAANAARQRNMADALVRVLALTDAKPEITNDDVQRALGVSDSTATDYLNTLVAQGKLRRVGDLGRPVRYVKNG